MNFLRMADGVSGLFPQKVKVKLIHNASNETIGMLTLNAEKIPEKFDKPTLIEVKGKVWRVTAVNIEREGSYWLAKKIVLFVVEPEMFAFTGRFAVPTLAASGPELSGTKKEGCTLLLEGEEWRQVEFLKLEMADQVQEAVRNIDPILNPDLVTNCLLGYEKIFVRNDSFDHGLGIPLGDFLLTIQAEITGGVYLSQQGRVKDCIHVISPNYEYYAICKDNIVTDLCIRMFDVVDDELMTLMRRFQLMMADWCNARVYMVPPDDAPEISIVKLN